MRPAARLANLMVARLDWMDAVAAYKRAHHLPVFDASREAAVLKATTAKAEAQGLPAKAAEGFIKGQMAAARQVQAEWLAATRGTITDASRIPDLTTTIRPNLDRITTQMLAALRETRESQAGPLALSAAESRLTKAGYSKEVIALAMQGLRDGLAR
jgi:chorismate mutase